MSCGPPGFRHSTPIGRVKGRRLVLRFSFLVEVSGPGAASVMLIAFPIGKNRPGKLLSARRPSLRGGLPLVGSLYGPSHPGGEATNPLAESSRSKIWGWVGGIRRLLRFVYPRSS